MKKTIFSLGLVIISIVLITCLSFAATGSKVQKVEQTAAPVVNDYTSVHHVVTGLADNNLGHFTTNDWDSYSGSWDVLSQSEWNYLDSLYLGAGTTWYIDTTGQTYDSTSFNDWSTTDTVVYSETTYTNQNGRIVMTTIHYAIVTVNGVDYQIVWSGYDSSPIMLDLNKDRRIDVAFGKWEKHAPKFYSEYARIFDITGDGTEDLTEWVVAQPKDGFLVMPEGGAVTSALQLFGTAGGYNDGYEKLSILCDKDKNGSVEGDELEGLAIWLDGNSDGVCQSNELSKLEDHNIKRISTKHVNYVSSYELNDGTVCTMWDWWPCVAETRKFRASR